MKKHPTDQHLQRLLEQDRDRRIVVLHLAACPRCQERFAGMVRCGQDDPPERDEPDGRGGDGRGDRTDRGGRGDDSGPDDRGWGGGGGGEPSDSEILHFAVLLLRERTEAPELFEALLRHGDARREEALRADYRFHTWGLFELLVERSLETVTQDSGEAEKLGLLALVLSEHLHPGTYGRRAIVDLRIRALAYIGNARRVRSDLAGAEKAFDAAHAHLQRGTKDPLDLAILLDLEASLRRDQRRVEEAADLLRQAGEIFLETGDSHRAGRSLVNLSTVHYVTGELEEALSVVRRSLDLLDMEREPRLRLYAQHSLAFYLTEAGRFQEAREVYRKTRPLYRAFPEPWVENRRKWVRGRIVRGLGHPSRAESILLAARDGFISEGIPYDTALISLEIATLYAEQGRTAELKRLAAEMVPIFTSLHIHREALAALAFLTQAIEAEAASLEVVTAVANYLRRAEHEPDLRFQAPGTSKP